MIDFTNVISGKWRIPIMAAIYNDRLRYTDIQNRIPTITPRMLSKELKELEANGIVVRTVFNTIPVKIEYSLSDSAKELGNIIKQMLEWGVKHRKQQLSISGLSQ
ncbi:winged helix-turn-helix transcriptional regulator [Chryseobacterium sp. JV274]|uniref:winged helix-turn-helix transcriptional regulator n=1 Tax=Chryseobacterium sp. JV274 TaxID=1932669 RepID=UPI0021CFE7EB|nr:helix-turn-helix domain-containing protein [Chryseobacterium sp. JV274]